MVPEKKHIAFHETTAGDPSLPGILFLHGFLGSGNDWLPAAELLETRYRSILVDLPGHGSTKIPDDADPESFFTDTVEALAGMLQRSPSPPRFLVGYSMGGRIALALVLRFPALFMKSIIVSSSPGLAAEKDRTSRIKSDEGIARKIESDFEGFIGTWYDQPLFDTLKTHHLFSDVESRRIQCSSPEEIAAAIRLLGTGRQPSFWEYLHENRVPIRFFVGEKDLKFVEIGRQMVNLCPYSSMELFPGCGHTLHIENMRHFADRLEAFFNTHQTS